jgi:hypothetical protein
MYTRGNLVQTPNLGMVVNDAAIQIGSCQLEPEFRACIIDTREDGNLEGVKRSSGEEVTHNSGDLWNIMP